MIRRSISSDSFVLWQFANENGVVPTQHDSALAFSNSSVIFFRLSMSGTTATFSVSLDNSRWIVVCSATVTSFTPAEAGFVSGVNASGTIGLDMTCFIGMRRNVPKESLATNSVTYLVADITSSATTFYVQSVDELPEAPFRASVNQRIGSRHRQVVD